MQWFHFTPAKVKSLQRKMKPCHYHKHISKTFLYCEKYMRTTKVLFIYAVFLGESAIAIGTEIWYDLACKMKEGNYLK